MDKQKVIAQLRKAKSAHIRWRSYAQALVSGVPLDADRVPVIHTDCEFGRWYYGDGQALAPLTGFRDIAEPHEQLHAIYMEIFKHLFQPERGGLLSRLIGKKRRDEGVKQATVQSLLNELLRVSERLLGCIETLEKEVNTSDDDTLARLT